MTGRGIDQVLAHPGSPQLFEPSVKDARFYIELAEHRHGPIPRPAAFAYPWGDALAEMARADLRLINLETSITAGGAPWPGKYIHYRMHPANMGCLVAARIDVCALANNHVLDWGAGGLAQTLQSLDGAGIAHSGAGLDAARASVPAVLEVAGKGRTLVFSFGSISSGIPRAWQSTTNRSGVNLLADFSDATATRLAEAMRRARLPGDLLVASIHWDANWNYQISPETIAFAHRLIDEGVSLVHGHSSHHAKAIEVYRGRLILYGCGDFLTDYEGISGYERFRGDLALMYLPELEVQSGRLLSLGLIPLKSRRFRLEHASPEDTRWLCELFERLGEPFGTRVAWSPGKRMRLEWR